MDLALGEKNVLISAAGGGLGPALAEAFWDEGANIYLVSRSREKLEGIVSSLPPRPEQHADFLALDLSATSSPAALVRSLNEQGFSPDVVIHHLGGPLGVKSSLSSYESWQKVLWLNVFFASELNRLLVEDLKKKGWARIVHISSISANNLRGSGPYGCAKALLNAYTCTLGRELAETNVVVSAVLPGAIYSPGGPWDQHMKHNPGVIDDFLRHHHACGRLGTPDEIVPTVLFLSSMHMTFSQGALINVDGGTM